MIIWGIVWYIKAMWLRLHSGAFTEKKANWRNNKVGLSPTWDDGPVGWQQSVANNQLGRELEYWLARAPKRLQPQSFSFYLLWQHHTVSPPPPPPHESPFFYSLQWFIINCTERKPQYNTVSIMEKRRFCCLKKEHKSNSWKNPTELFWRNYWLFFWGD